jgi:hypothetical protein
MQVEYLRHLHVCRSVKTKYSWLRLTAISTLIACIGSSVSCMTTYDANGNPVQSVDPALAVAGVAAAGLIGYAVANNNCHYYPGAYAIGYYGPGYYARGYYGGRYYRGGYYRGGNYGAGYNRGGYQKGNYSHGPRVHGSHR